MNLSHKLIPVMLLAALGLRGGAEPEGAPGYAIDSPQPTSLPWEYVAASGFTGDGATMQAMAVNPDPGNTGTIAYSAWADNPDSDEAIANLAAILGNNPVLIYEWVRNNVRTEFYYGASRGAYLTMLERAGNDVDQCALLGALFKAANYTPVYRLEFVHVPRTASGPNRLGVYEWLGVDNDTGALDILEWYEPSVEASGTIRFACMWVSIDIPGRGETRFAPSLKPHSVGRRPDLDALSGYTRAGAIAASGSSSPGNYSGAIESGDLKGYFNNLSVTASNAIRFHTDLHDLSGAELARLPVVVPEAVSVTTPLATQYPEGVIFPANAQTLPLSGIPVSYCSWLEIKVGSSVTARFDQTSLRGKPLAVDFDGNGHGRIRLDGAQVEATETSGNSGGSVSVTITYETPAAFHGGVPQRFTGGQTVPRQNSVAIVYATGRAVNRLQKQLQDLAAKEVTTPANVTEGDRLQLIGCQYLSQLHELVSLGSAYLLYDYRQYFAGGLIYQRSGKPIVSINIHLSERAVRSASAPPKASVVKTTNLLMGALEGTAIEQHNGARAFGTPSMFDQAMTLDRGAHYITSQSELNAAGIANLSDSYLGGGAMADIQASLGNGKHVVLLSNSEVSFNGQIIGGFLRVDPSAGFVASMIQGAKGAVSTATTGSASVGQQQKPSEETNPATHGKVASSDPVDLTNGAFFKDDTDLVLGNDDSPNGLRLARNYNSARHNSDPTGLGRGWTHSYALRLQMRSPNDFDALRAGYDEVLPVLLAVRHVQDILQQESQAARSWLMACTALTWAVDQQINSRASIALGARSMEFVRRPDGTYAPPSHITASLVRNSDSSHALAFRHGNTITFRASDGRFTTIEDLFDNLLTATYTTAGRLQTVTDAYSRSFTFTYDGTGRLTGVSDSTLRSVSYGRDGLGHFTFTDAEGKTQTLEWNGDFLVTRVRDARGRTVVENDYDFRKQVWRQRTFGESSRTHYLDIMPGMGAETDPAGGTVRTYFDASGRRIFVADQNNALSQWHYDGIDRLIATTTPKGESRDYSYNAGHVLVAEVDEAGNSRTIEPDAWHRPLRVRTFENQETVIEYWNNTSALVKKTTAPGGIVSEFTYDGRGRLLTAHPAHYASGAVDSYDYDGNGHVNKITRPADANPSDQDFDDYLYHVRGDLLEMVDRRDVRTTYEYNARRQLRKTNQWEGSTPRTTEIVFDDAGDVDYTKDASGRQVDLDHNALGDLIETKRGPAGSLVVTLTRTYNTRNLLAESKFHPDAGTTLSTTYTYHATQKVATVNDPLNRTTEFGYDANQRPVSVKTPLGRSSGDPNYATSTIWDSRGLKDGVRDAAGQVVDYTYDRDGRMKTLANRLNQTFQWSYDDANRTVTSSTPTGKTTTTVANARGLPHSVQEPSTDTTTFNTYDAEGRLMQKTDGVGVTTYTYWPNGLLKTVTEGGKTTTRTYDALNRLASYADGEGNTINYLYHPSGELWKLTYPGNKTVTYEYDAFGRLWTVTDWANRQTTYTYDHASRLTRIDRPNSTYRIQEYDATSQLRGIREYTAAGAVIVYQDLRYDADGRITYSFVHPKPALFTLPGSALDYDADNRLSSWNAQAVTFDADGNMTHGPLPSGAFGAYGYDTRNRLTSAGGSGYTYNPDGLRTAITGNGAATFVVDPNAALSRTLSRMKAGVITYYVYGLGLLYEETGGAIKAYHANQVGSTLAITDGGGNITDRIGYSPFGEITERAGTTDTPFLFNGRSGAQTDANGLHFMRARYYNAYITRFINADPVGFAGGMNWYVFAGNNPLSYIDPSGFGRITPDGKLAQAHVAGVMTAVSRMIVALLSLGAQAGAIDPHGGLPDPQVSERINAATAMAMAKANAGITGITGIAEENLDRQMADGATDIAFSLSGITGAIRNIFTRSAVIAAETGTVRGFRAVSTAELDDIAANGFRTNPKGTSMPDKWFSESAEGAQKFTKIFPDLKHVVEADIPKSVYEQSYRHPNIDMTGPGFAVPPELLSKIKPR